MFSLDRIETYRENARLEAKLATGGLPESLWETYSAFANSYGGVILLGVEERSDHSLRIQGLLDAQEMLEEFLTRVQDPQTVSADLVSEERARVESTPHGDIIVIEVPWAEDALRPVYVGRDPYHGTYRREGEADLRCSPPRWRPCWRGGRAEVSSLFDRTQRGGAFLLCQPLPNRRWRRPSSR